MSETFVPSDVEVVHMKRKNLAFERDLLLNEVHANVSLDYMRLAHVAHSAYQAQTAVAQADHCVLREH